MTKRLYARGLTLMESLRLRVKHVALFLRRITMRDGMGPKERVTILPENLVPALTDHLPHVRALHETDPARSLGAFSLPHAVILKAFSALHDWPWQFAFPARPCSRAPLSLRPSYVTLGGRHISRSATPVTSLCASVRYIGINARRL